MLPDPGMFFIGCQMLGDIVRVPDGCADNAVPAKRLFQPVPVHLVFAENMAQSPERDIEFSQKKGLSTSFVIPAIYGVTNERRIV